MSDINADNYRLFVFDDAQLGRVQNLVGPTSLQVELKCHIGEVLVLTFLCHEFLTNNTNCVKSCLTVTC
jgi:hypothetical protein